jgi:N-acetylmuramic acid 6-phosphate etherase
MVNMRTSNAKLRLRAAAMVADLGGGTAAQAHKALDVAGGDIKLAVLLRAGMGLAGARALLKRHRGNLRAALAGGLP